MITLREIKKEVEMHTGIEDISIKKSDKVHVSARYLYFKCAKKLTIETLERIGEPVKKRLASVYIGLEAYESIENLSYYNNLLKQIESKLTYQENNV